MFVEGGESVKRTDLETGVGVEASILDALLWYLPLMIFVVFDDGLFNDEVVVALREGLSCCAAVKSGDRDGSLGCDMLLRKGTSVSILAEKP